MNILFNTFFPLMVFKMLLKSINGKNDPIGKNTKNYIKFEDILLQRLLKTNTQTKSLKNKPYIQT
ncbi:hypothetical protein BpHYR1_013851 [Brachionus plicatilis]|uniref:Uncharacterized protein n=1 Tax=Brachionus plicatilis TaxID=10195 RepID=A0A3M7RSG9_BRAPC|nr:hypothetical protein BpHYR1_013851 [Brachionus plicatilis]